MCRPGRAPRKDRHGEATGAALLESEDSATTSFVERLNLTIRQGSAYLRRRSPCHARGEDQLRSHVELVRCHYNFVRPHRALRFGCDTRTPDAGRSGRTRLALTTSSQRAVSLCACWWRSSTLAWPRCRRSRGCTHTERVNRSGASTDHPVLGGHQPAGQGDRKGSPQRYAYARFHEDQPLDHRRRGSCVALNRSSVTSRLFRGQRPRRNDRRRFDQTFMTCWLRSVKPGRSRRLPTMRRWCAMTLSGDCLSRRGDFRAPSRQAAGCDNGVMGDGRTYHMHRDVDGGRMDPQIVKPLQVGDYRQVLQAETTLTDFGGTPSRAPHPR